MINCKECVKTDVCPYLKEMSKKLRDFELKNQEIWEFVVADLTCKFFWAKDKPKILGGSYEQ